MGASGRPSKAANGGSIYGALLQSWSLQFCGKWQSCPLASFRIFRILSFAQDAFSSTGGRGEWLGDYVFQH